MQIKIDIVGGRIAGMSTAIALKENNPSLNVVVHEIIYLSTDKQASLRLVHLVLNPQ